MEPLYPQKIIERLIPFLRELREKAEQEAVSKGPRNLESVSLENDDWFSREKLYFEVPYEGGPAGKNLNTFA